MGKREIKKKVNEGCIKGGKKRWKRIVKDKGIEGKKEKGLEEGRTGGGRKQEKKGVQSKSKQRNEAGRRRKMEGGRGIKEGKQMI